jgi:hypothetical protein
MTSASPSVSQPVTELPALLTAARNARDAGVPLERPALSPVVDPSSSRELREIAAFRPIAAALDELEQLLPDHLGLGKPFRWSTSIGEDSTEPRRTDERATSGHFRVGSGWSEIRVFERNPGDMVYGVGAESRYRESAQTPHLEQALYMLVELLVRYE